MVALSTMRYCTDRPLRHLRIEIFDVHPGRAVSLLRESLTRLGLNYLNLLLIRSSGLQGLLIPTKEVRLLAVSVVHQVATSIYLVYILPPFVFDESNHASLNARVHTCLTSIV